jgi:ketosteroid isomerase-like protein
MGEPAAVLPQENDEDLHRIMDVLSELCECIARNDIDGVISHFVDGDEVVMFGAEELAVARGHEELTRLWTELLSRGHSYQWIWDTTLVRVRGGVAWLCSEAGVRVIDQVTLHRAYRLTLVMSEHDGTWKIEQFHGSEPVTAWA